MKLIIILTLLTTTSQANSRVRSSVTVISRTNNRKECMTNCIPYKDYHFCYLGWGSRNWEKCKVQNFDRQVQYYTSMFKGNNPLCTSKCDYYGESYQWCFTGEGGRWDKCSTNKQKCYDCAKYPEGYLCRTLDNNINHCAPDPIHYYQFDRTKDLLKNYVGKYTAQGYIKQLCKTRKTRQFSDDEVRVEGIHNHANFFGSSYNVTYLKNGPIDFITTITVPPLRPETHVTRLPIVIRAKLQRKFLNNVEKTIPSYIGQQMVKMDREPNDETGNLLAASLGGPMQDFNFAPQTPIVNRNDGGESYWYLIEQNIRERLSDDNVDYIDWTLLVIYDELQVTRRPIGFGLRYIEYDHQKNRINDSGDMIFSNDDEGGCLV